MGDITSFYLIVAGSCIVQHFPILTECHADLPMHISVDSCLCSCHNMRTLSDEYCRQIFADLKFSRRRFPLNLQMMLILILMQENPVKFVVDS